MLSKPTPEALKALHALSRQTSWGEFDKLLGAELQATLKLLVDSRDAPVLHQLQGRAKLLQDIQQLVRDVPAQLKALGHTGL